MTELSWPQRLRQALATENAKTLAELSAELSISEKELPALLEKLERSLRREGVRLSLVPACCIGCGFEFTERTRFKRPSRCPKCRSGRIAPAAFRVS